MTPNGNSWKIIVVTKGVWETGKEGMSTKLYKVNKVESDLYKLLAMKYERINYFKKSCTQRKTGKNKYKNDNKKLYSAGKSLKFQLKI